MFFLVILFTNFDMHFEIFFEKRCTGDGGGIEELPASQGRGEKEFDGGVETIWSVGLGIM